MAGQSATDSFTGLLDREWRGSCRPRLRHRGVDTHDRQRNLPADEVGGNQRRALVGHMGELQPCLLLEHFHHQVMHRADARRTVVVLARLAFNCAMSSAVVFAGNEGGK